MKPRSLLLSVSTLLGVLVSDGRAQQRTSLNGIWQIRRDHEPDGAYQPVQVPGAFETVLGTDFDGVARYRRTLPLPAKRTNKVFAEFDAVATHARVFVNGRQVKEHLGGWTPFRADLTRHLKWDGKDLLEVVVDERVGHNTQGFLPIIQPHFGGIWQGVTLCCSDTPTIDRNNVFVFGTGDGEVTVTAGIVGTNKRADGLHIEVLDGDTVVTAQTRQDLQRFHEPLVIPSPRLWRPGTPHLYTVRLSLLIKDKPVDTIERRFGCRSLRANGTHVIWNDLPLQMRGILHWGHSPPALAPPTDPSYWRPQLEYFQSLGFNTIKCCLWVPPRGFYELCDELGMLVWQEYPTWHPKMDQEHKRELLMEYREFFRFDRSHPSVAFRSITCETGQGADLDVVTTLFQACKTMVPDTLVVDDSSWIGWQRITDFWDEHPYGNNSWFPGRIKQFQKHIEEKGPKPLLLGECMAADTWLDRGAWLATHGEQDLWWRPWCWNAQREAEQWLTREFGSELVASLRPTSLQFGLDNRRFQIEQLRRHMPEAGYVVSVARDFPKARMGLLDDLDRPKWRPEHWHWQGDTMLCMESNSGMRSVGYGDGVAVRVLVSHFGTTPLRGKLRVWCTGTESCDDGSETEIELAPGEPLDTAMPSGANAAHVMFGPFGARSKRIERIRIHAELSGSHPLKRDWDLWYPPKMEPIANRDTILEADALTPELLEQLEAGARVFLRVGEHKHTLSTTDMWFLKGAPFAPQHALHDAVPAQCLLETVAFDLESGRVMPWAPWRDQVDPILAFWETHDIDQVRFHLHAFDTQVGKGRLLATALRQDGDLAEYVVHAMKDHLANGPAPKRSLRPETIAALKARLRERTIELPTWRFRVDPDNVGQSGNWQDPAHDASTDAWRDLLAGSHWENQGEDLKHFTGVAWYRVDVEVPEDWRGIDARCVLEGVDDSFHIWLNGELLGVYGDEASKTTIWLEPQVAELQQRLRPGKRNTIVLRVVDHAGAGGLWKPVRLTTGPVGAGQHLLR